MGTKQPVKKPAKKDDGSNVRISTKTKNNLKVFCEKNLYNMGALADKIISEYIQSH